MSTAKKPMCSVPTETSPLHHQSNTSVNANTLEHFYSLDKCDSIASIDSQRKIRFTNAFTKGPYHIHKQIKLNSPSEIRKGIEKQYSSIKKQEPNSRLVCHKEEDTGGDILQGLNKFILNEDNYHIDDFDQSNQKYEKELLKTYNINTLFDNTTDIIHHARHLSSVKYKLDNDIANLDIESRRKLEQRTKLPLKHDIQRLKRWLDHKINSIISSNMDENTKYNQSAIVYMIALLEISRQESIMCLERGNIVTDIWMRYFNLYQSKVKSCVDENADIQNRMEHLLNDVQQSKDLIISMLKDKVQELEKTVKSQAKDISELNQYTNDLGEALIKRKNENEEHLQTIDKLRQTLAIKDSENKSLRMLGGGYNANNANGKVDETGISIKTLREMMVRNRGSKDSRARVETPEPKVNVKLPGILYSDISQLDKRKKLTLSNLKRDNEEQ